MANIRPGSMSRTEAPLWLTLFPSRAVTNGGGPPFIIPLRPSLMVASHPLVSPSRSAIDNGESPQDYLSRSIIIVGHLTIFLLLTTGY